MEKKYYTDNKIIYILERAGENNTEVDEVFKFLYRKVFNNIASFVTRNRGSKEEAYDVFVDSFIILTEKIQNNKFQKEGMPNDISSYIYSVSRNRWLYELREKKKKGVELSIADLSFISKFIVDEEDSDSIKNEQIEHIISLINSMGESCKDVLHGFYFKGLSLEEIAERKNYTSTDSVKSIKSRCLQRLLKKYLQLQERAK